MNQIASKGQLRLSFLRWAVFTVPLILFLGFLSGSLAPSGSANPWFTQLEKPALMPPNWAFPVAWTTLYILLGVALALVLNARGARHRGAAIALFVAQMLLNLAWSPVFFGLRQIEGALWILAGMFVLAAITAYLFWRIRAAAGLLLIPYLAWIAFAGYLLFQIDALNPGANLVRTGVTDQIQIR